MNQKLVRLRTVFAVGRHRDPADGFLSALSAHEGLYVGRWGRRLRGRRWLNLASTPIRFRAEGSRAWRCFIAIGMVLSGGLSQMLVDVSTKGIAVGRRDGHAGLDVLPTVGNDSVCWTIVRFWAWPIGQGYGRSLIKDVLAAADESGATLLLQAGNRRLAEYFYAPLGFEVQQGDETAKRPWIERTPAAAVTLTGSASRRITAATVASAPCDAV
ncbi:GNAT superfamily N-acetyltransferase [Catenulispora sp. GAS73]|uniref:hypothetical protein n=1 Tax=Catenulispora sp. GAS73 TaxID=3156269 RepID=UPI003512A9B6